MFMISSKMLPITSFKLKQDTRLLELFSCTRYIVILLGYICCIKRAAWVDYTLGCEPGWTVRRTAFTVLVVPARIMQVLDWGGHFVEKGLEI